MWSGLKAGRWGGLSSWHRAGLCLGGEGKAQKRGNGSMNIKQEYHNVELESDMIIQ